MTTIYRYEDAAGIGPYTSQDIYWNHNHRDLAHPSPAYEGYGLPARSEFCALSAKQFPIWFTREECEELEELGFRLKRYDIDDDLLRFVGEKQVVFAKHEAPYPVPADYKEFYV